MCETLTACDGRRVKLWGKEFNLLHEFAPGESFVELPVEAAAARSVVEQSRETGFRMYLTMDHGGTRWTAGLSGYSYFPSEGKLRLDWSADVVPVRGYGSPFNDHKA